jgi:protein-disulfide isomerase/uncharacterized membrane protein
VAGAVLAGVLVWLHLQLAHDSSYTSFCNINTRINCDLVLSSKYSKVFGVPIAWLAFVMYASLAMLFQAAGRVPDESIRRRALQLACAGTIGAAAFSAYMAYVSVALLGSICLMCSGLYLISAALFVIGLLLPSRYARDGSTSSAPPLTARAMAVLGVVALVAVAGLARAAWHKSSSIGANLTLDQLREADPKFYDWYVALPIVSSLEDGGHVLGNVAAPVTIVEFSDFECGYCARNHEILNELIDRQPDLVRVIYRHFPLDAACNEALEKSIHSRACRAAEAAECAARQNRFHEMADTLFANQKRLFEANLFQLAGNIGLDQEEFSRCMNEHTTRAAVIADAQTGVRLDLQSTPTLFINGRKVVGTLPDLDRYEHAVLIEARLRAGDTRKTEG